MVIVPQLFNRVQAICLDETATPSPSSAPTSTREPPAPSPTVLSHGSTTTKTTPLPRIPSVEEGLGSGGGGGETGSPVAPGGAGVVGILPGPAPSTGGCPLVSYPVTPRLEQAGISAIEVLLIVAPSAPSPASNQQHLSTLIQSHKCTPSPSGAGTNLDGHPPAENDELVMPGRQKYKSEDKIDYQI